MEERAASLKGTVVAASSGLSQETMEGLVDDVEVGGHAVTVPGNLGVPAARMAAVEHAEALAGFQVEAGPVEGAAAQQGAKAYEVEAVASREARPVAAESTEASPAEGGQVVTARQVADARAEGGLLVRAAALEDQATAMEMAGGVSAPVKHRLEVEEDAGQRAGAEVRQQLSTRPET